MTDEAPRRRSLLVTAAGLLLVAGSAPLLPVSLASLLMLLAGSEGTRSATLLGAVVVVGGPPAALLVGLGLWRRWRWARASALPLLAGVALWGVAESLRRPVPAATRVTPDGVVTHVAATDAAGPFAVAATVAALGLLALLLTRRVRDEFLPARTSTASRAGRLAPPAPAARRTPVDDAADESRGWRVGHRGRDELYYAELRDEGWQRIAISGEMLTGRAQHVIYFASPRDWLAYPAWARDRRDEIVARVKSAFRPPDYEYRSDGPARGPSGPSGAADLAAPPRAQAAAASPSQRRAATAALLLLLALAGGMAWLVGHGIGSGTTFLPIRHGSAHRVVERAGEPATFWLSIGVYAALGAGSIGLAAWGLCAALRRDDR